MNMLFVKSLKKSHNIFFLFFISSFSSCSYFKLKDVTLEKGKSEYTLEEKSGNFLLKKEIGYSKNGQSFIVKTQIFSSEKMNEFVEQSVSISYLKKHSSGVPLLYPNKGQTDVWFDKSRYRTSFKIVGDEIVFYLKTPEKKWSGVRKFKLPEGNGVFCLFSQLPECIRYIGFIKKSIKFRGGSMRLYVIWDSYPFIQEQYEHINKGPFIHAEFKYEGRYQGLYRFGLHLSGQVIYYSFNQSEKLIRENWISQGRSLNLR